jgi:aspartyl-tRNA(Asn)/glutamyl-tRNA(Gln) amidotransferase subunit C
MIDAEAIEKLLTLNRIAATDEEKSRWQVDLTTLERYITLLEEVDTSNVEPGYRVLETLKNVMRPDELTLPLDRALFLANAPDHVAGLIRVPPVLKS